MPTLPPALPSPIDGDLPVQQLSDVTQYLPSSLAVSEPTVVLDALLTSFAELALEYQLSASYAAAQSDPARASDEYLEGLAGDRGVNKQVGESDLQLQGRVFTPPDQTTPESIIGLVNSILAPVTTIKAQYLESIQDRLYIFDGNPSGPHSFIGPVSPEYLSRFYRDDSVANGGVVIQGRDPGGAWVFSDEVGRYFIIRIPVLTSTNDIHDFFYNSFIDPSSVASINQSGFGNGIGSFIGDGSNSSGSELDGSVATFIFKDTTTDLQVYQAIADKINGIKGHSIRFMLYVDSNLVS